MLQYVAKNGYQPSLDGTKKPPPPLGPTTLGVFVTRSTRSDLCIRSNATERVFSSEICHDLYFLFTSPFWLQPQRELMRRTTNLETRPGSRRGDGMWWINSRRWNKQEVISLWGLEQPFLRVQWLGSNSGPGTALLVSVRTAQTVYTSWVSSSSCDTLHMTSFQ